MNIWAIVAFRLVGVNFAPMNAFALLSGARLPLVQAMLMPVLASWLSDLFLNTLYFKHWVWFYPGCYWQYGSYVLIACLGRLVKRYPALAIISASLLFFTISNFGVWYTCGLYPPTWGGLVACYIAALPFVSKTILSDIFFSVLFLSCYDIRLSSLGSMVYSNGIKLR